MCAKAKKLPSGNWRVLLYDGKQDGKRVYRSFTARTKKEAEYRASSYRMDRQRQDRYKTVGAAMREYIGLREATLSPATTKQYLSVAQNTIYNDPIADAYIEDLTVHDLQSWIGRQAGYSGKTVNTRYALLLSAIKMYRPDFSPKVTTPKVQKPQFHLPTDAEVKALLMGSRGTQLEAAILLAAFGPLRRGEICALTQDDITGDVVTVRHSMALNKDNDYVIKSPKTPAGVRTVRMPPGIMPYIRSICPNKRLFTYRPNNLTVAFENLLKAVDVPHMRFHDLRHYAASVMHSLRIPEQYAMLRGGWESAQTMRNVYTAAFDDKRLEADKTINDYFLSLLESEKAPTL